MMGNVINKPVEQFIIENVLHKLKIMPAYHYPAIGLDKSVFSGSPIADDRGFILHTPCEDFGFSIGISPQTIITTSNDVLKMLGTAEQPDNVLISLSYFGGEHDQLEYELLKNTSLITPCGQQNSILYPHRYPLARSG